MIIGKNTNFQPKQNNFIKPNENRGFINPTTKPNPTMQHADIMNKNEMHDKAFSILQERYNQGLISLEEFNKKCEQLGKRK